MGVPRVDCFWMTFETPLSSKLAGIGHSDEVKATTGAQALC